MFFNKFLMAGFEPGSSGVGSDHSANCAANFRLWIQISDPYKFCFYCSATHVTSQVLQPKSVNKRYEGATRLAVSIQRIFSIQS